MKIAGRKNNGAWFRTNKAIHALTNPERESLQSAFVEACGAKAAAVYTNLQAMAAEVGAAWPPAGSTDATGWLTTMVTHGIPLQIWRGRFTFTTYSNINGPGVPPKYKANYQSQIHYFAKDMRRFMKYWLFGRRQIKDAFDLGGANEGNPGGQPDSDITT